MEKETIEQLTRTLKLLPMHVQALQTDCLLHFSNEETLSTIDRRNMVVNDIKVIEELLLVVKKTLINSKDQELTEH